MADVAVAIPTFRRPNGLARLLDALARLETDAAVEVLVADNDAEGREGLALCDRMAPSYRWPLEAILVEERGIAQARNGLVAHLLAHSDAPFIAMLDDDEWPRADWLEGFRRVQRQTGADALRGTILRAFEAPPSPQAALLLHADYSRAPSGLTPMIDGAGNIFVSRACFAELDKPCFDPAFGLTGGEDRDFFTRLHAMGKRFARAEEAVCYEAVPASRASLRWVLKRAYRVGNSDMRVFLKHRPSAAARLVEIAKAFGAVVLYPFFQLLCALPPKRRALPLCKLARAAGKIAALLGIHYREYAHVHGG